MDWHLLEVGLVTTLALWVYLFSPTQGSRAVAMIVFWINVLWVLFERDPAALKPAVPQRPASSPGELATGNASGAAAEEQNHPTEGGQAAAADRPGTHGRVI